MGHHHLDALSALPQPAASSPSGCRSTLSSHSWSLMAHQSTSMWPCHHPPLSHHPSFSVPLYRGVPQRTSSFSLLSFMSPRMAGFTLQPPDGVVRSLRICCLFFSDLGHLPNFQTPSPTAESQPTPSCSGLTSRAISSGLSCRPHNWTLQAKSLLSPSSSSLKLK